MKPGGAKGPVVTQPPPVPPVMLSGFSSGVGVTGRPLPPKPVRGEKTWVRKGSGDVGLLGCASRDQSQYLEG